MHSYVIVMSRINMNLCLITALIVATTHLSEGKSAAFLPAFRVRIAHSSLQTNLFMARPQMQARRNRGANAANHNRRGHEFRLSKDSKRKKTKRAPRWEREGDQLYAEISKRINKDEDDMSVIFESLNKEPIESVDDVHRFLNRWRVDGSIHEEESTIAKKDIEPSDETGRENTKLPPFLWGSLPVGPVLSSRLYSSDRSSPTSVQKAAFSILAAGKNSKRTNAIIASPTGTGKTLAYLLPLLCTSPGGQFGEGTGGVLIVTPTIELACQIQREVNVLWPIDEAKGGHSAVFVVGDGSDSDSAHDENDDDISPGRVILRSIPHSPIIAGTPKMLRMLYREAERVKRNARIDPSILSQELSTSKELLTNMRAIVLDEADRLLRTEAVARETAERKERKVAQRMAEEFEDEVPKKKKRLIIARETQTELLLRDLPIPSLQDVQIICASATVGRTMRRQLMQILDVPSADAAATLITGEDDARVKSKDSEKRKSVLLPEKLQHSYRVVDISSISDELPDMSVAEQNEERVIRATVSCLWDTILSLEAKPLLVFPGKIGVERVQQDLVNLGLQDVRTLRNLDGETPEYPPAENADTSPWKSVPVYIIGERFARGLDLPNVQYVAILSPPSSAAGYAHMAGRTGRSGKSGTAITFIRPKNNEVKRLAAIAEALRVKFNPDVL